MIFYFVSSGDGKAMIPGIPCSEANAARHCGECHSDFGNSILVELFRECQKWALGTTFSISQMSRAKLA
jgi:hypothetical protein